MKSNFTKLLLKASQPILRFLNLLDYEGNLSISNIAVIVLITKIAVSPLDWPTAAGLMIALLNYHGKRITIKKSGEK